MCGILVVWDRSGGRVDPRIVAHMNALIHHRGPDDEGYAFFDTASGARRLYWGPDTPEGVRTTPTRYAPLADVATAAPADAAGSRTAADLALAGRRLAILDLTPAGHQPMSSRDEQAWLSFNGEVYNYLEMREDLAALGHTFDTAGDTEVLLHAYQEWGPDCLARMNGMWGFALWDQRERRLFVARDRLGVKQLYVTQCGPVIAIASEITPLLALRGAHGLSPAPHWPTVRRFLDAVLIDAGDQTFFADIRRVPPAHALIIAPDAIREWQYWSIPPRAADAPRAAERFAALFDDSVRLRLRSDVPVGTCLSGGLDSSSVVACAAPRLPHAMHSFSVAYDAGGPFDERRYVRLVTDRYRTNAHVTVPDGSDLFALMPRLVRHQEEPGGGGGLYSQWHVMRIAHDARIKVLLDGQGGDELLAGYVTYVFYRLNDLLAAGRVGEWARVVRDAARLHRLGTTHTLGRALQGVIPRRLFAWAGETFGAGRTRILGPRLLSVERDTLPELPRVFADRMTQMQYRDVLHFLPSLLRYEDRNSMAHSIEARLPFLDYRLVEFVFGLPPEERVRRGVTKAVLRDAMKDRVPREILARRDKVGYDTPTDVWFRTRFRADVESLLLSPRTAERGVFDPVALRARLAEFMDGRPLPHQVWRWVHLEAWFRMFVDGEDAPWRIAR